MGDHAVVRRQAGPQARALPAAQATTSTCRSWASASPSSSHGILRALVDVDAGAAREVAELDDEVDDLYHAIFDEVPRADARRPGATSSAGRGSCSRRTTSSASATG